MEAPEATAPATAETTTTESTTTTEPAATILITTTVAPPESTTTAVPPPKDPPSDAELIAEIEADLNDGEVAFLEGAADPGAPKSIELAHQYNTGTSLEFIRNFYERLATAEIRVSLSRAKQHATHSS